MVCPGCNCQTQKVGTVAAREDDEGGAVVFRLCRPCAAFLTNMRPALVDARLDAIGRRLDTDPRRYGARYFPDACAARLAVGLANTPEVGKATISALFSE